MSLLSKFDPEAFIKPKTKEDFLALLDEAISEVKNLSTIMDEQLQRSASESFRVNGHTFYQYMDKDDAAHIEWLSPEKKEEVLSNNRVALADDIVEIFVFDSHCDATNINGAHIGRVQLIDWKSDKWIFRSAEINGKTYTIDLVSKYPYDGEREVIKWMVENNLLQTFIELK